mgnify:FL=1
MPQTSRVQKYQKLRDEIDHLGDAQEATVLPPSSPQISSRTSSEKALPDGRPLTDTITRGTVNIPIDDLIKTHSQITNDEFFLSEEQIALEDKKNRRWSIIGTIATIVVIVTLVIALALLLWRLEKL